jgi:hypothetical protein
LIRKVFGPLEAAGIECELVHTAAGPCGAVRPAEMQGAQGPALFDRFGHRERMHRENARGGRHHHRLPTYFAGVTPETKALIDRPANVARGNDNMFRRKLAPR